MKHGTCHLWVKCHRIFLSLHFKHLSPLHCIMSSLYFLIYRTWIYCAYGMPVNYWRACATVEVIDKSVWSFCTFSNWLSNKKKRSMDSGTTLPLQEPACSYLIQQTIKNRSCYFLPHKRFVLIDGHVLCLFWLDEVQFLAMDLEQARACLWRKWRVHKSFFLPPPPHVLKE